VWVLTEVREHKEYLRGQKKQFFTSPTISNGCWWLRTMVETNGGGLRRMAGVEKLVEILKVPAVVIQPDELKSFNYAG
jgi:hypothetical protein